VHLNKLKFVELRRVFGPSLPKPARLPDVDSTCDVFDDLLNSEPMEPDESDYESAVESMDGEEGLGGDANDLWCGLDEGNIIGPRTRSGIGGGGG
jgi:hypothetical protein